MAETTKIEWQWPENVWLGVSCENQEAADKRIPELLKIPARVRFVSAEPLLGPVDLSEWMYTLKVEHNGDGDTQEVPCRPDIHWVIIGGESGPHARPCRVDWIRSLVNQCKSAGVPCFVKQLGSKSVFNELTFAAVPDEPMRLRDPKGGDINEWPADLQVREIPNG